MENVELTKGRCALCRGPIDESWAGKDPSLGTTCESCFHKGAKVFGPENVRLIHTKQIVFTPLFGELGYHFNWKGTETLVNGHLARVISTQGDLAWMDIEGVPGNTRLGTPIKGLGYWDLLRIYKETGGEMKPELPMLLKHEPKKLPLLPETIIPVDLDMRGGVVHGVTIRTSEDIPFLCMLQAFANLFVRFKFGLAPNFCAEGGFIGKDFEVRNRGTMFGGRLGLYVSAQNPAEDLKYIRTVEDFRQIAMLSSVIGEHYDYEQSRPEVETKNADANTVIAVWLVVMDVLLRYDWRQEDEMTIAGVWRGYCRMWDLLLNIMPLERLTAAMDYAKNNKMNHCGSSF